MDIPIENIPTINSSGVARSLTEEITGLHGICKIPNHSKIIVNTDTKEECEKITQEILQALKFYKQYHNDTYTVYTDEKGIKMQFGVCMYVPRLDIWVLDELGNLYKTQELVKKE